MAATVPLMWRWKRWFWTRWQLLRFRLSGPQDIGPPPAKSGGLEVVPLGHVHPTIPLRSIVTVAQLPPDENKLGMRVLSRLGVFLDRIVPAMHPDLPEIDADTDDALAAAGISSYARVFRAPVRPAPYARAGAPDLGALATASPFAVLLERSDADGLQWDLRELADYEHQDDLCSLGVRVRFGHSTDGTDLTATAIESAEFGNVTPVDAEWERASQLAVCAATTHLALTRHFNYVHLISGNHWDVAARNRLPTDHPLYRLLWPHIFNSFYTNYGVTRAQLLPGGDFANMFSFTHAGLMAYFDAMSRRYDIAITDPVVDWSRRGLGREQFDAPTHTNLVELFDVMLAHSTRYLETYYDSDDALCADASVGAWLDELRSLVPNGLGAVDHALTRANLARLIAGYISEGSTIHDLAGTTLWDYQLWADSNPSRVHRDGRRMPLDVFQRVLNNNFALQLRRARLLADYGRVALDERGADLFTRFLEDCCALQAQYDERPAGPWRMEPRNLEINMNG